MALPELIANSSTPGSVVPIGTLAAAITSTSATAITTSGPAPAVLQGSGQFRIVIDSEIMLVTAGAATASWTVTRGVEGSTKATHALGASVWHYLTAAALDARYAQVGTDGTVGGPGGSGLTSSVVTDVSAAPKYIDSTGVADTSGLLYSASAGRWLASASVVNLPWHKPGANNNLALGSALAANTTGSGLVAVGVNALYANTTGNNLVAVGVNALHVNTTGTNSVAVGTYALYSNTTGNSSVAVGTYALYANTTGNYSVAVGTYALQANTTGSYSVAVGYGALYVNTTGNSSVAVGYIALYANTTGSYSVAVGYQAGYAPGGVSANATVAGTDNTFIGRETGAGNATDPSGMTTIGSRALGAGNYATSLGYHASANAAGAVAIGADHTGAGALAATQDYIVLGTAAHKLFVPGLPSADPAVPGQFYTNGAPAAGAPKAVMVSGG